MFTQIISMDCTKEQYERYLKDELLKMEYEERTGYWEQNDVISNNHNSEHGLIGNTYSNNRNTANRTYLGSFNAPLFLALAAMTDKTEGNYGEYVVGVNNGWFYKMRKEDKILPKYTLIRKATKKEIMERFGEKKSNHNTLENKLDQLNEKGQVEVNISFDTTELNTKIDKVIEFVMLSKEEDAINLLKSKGYKILKPTTWEGI